MVAHAGSTLLEQRVLCSSVLHSVADFCDFSPPAIRVDSPWAPSESPHLPMVISPDQPHHPPGISSSPDVSSLFEGLFSPLCPP